RRAPPSREGGRAVRWLGPLDRVLRARACRVAEGVRRRRRDGARVRRLPGGRRGGLVQPHTGRAGCHGGGAGRWAHGRGCRARPRDRRSPDLPPRHLLDPDPARVVDLPLTAKARGALTPPAPQTSKSTSSGAWSDGPLPFRATRSTTANVEL